MTSLNIATVTATSAGLTTATTAYTDGDQLGTGLSITMPSATGLILGAVLVDAAGVIGAVDAFVYDRAVTLAADNAADAISDADALFKVGKLEFPFPTSQANNRAAHLDSLGLPYFTNASSLLYVSLVTRSNNAVFAAVGNLQLRLTVSKDV